MLRRQLAINIIVSVIVMIISLVVYHDKFAPRIYSLDLKDFIANQQKMMIEGKLDDKGIDSNFNKLDELLNKKGNNAVILTSDVVIKGDKIEMD